MTLPGPGRIRVLMMLLVVNYMVAAAASDATDCPVCMRGNCLAPASFYNDIMKLNHVVHSQVVVYPKNNVMYYGDNNALRKINLDDNTSEVIPTLDKVTINIGIDAVTGDVYYHGKRAGNEHTIYKYQPKTNETVTLSVPKIEQQKPPYKLWVYNETVYFARLENNTTQLQKGLNIFDGTTVQNITAFENIHVVDIVFDTFGNMFIKSIGKLYKVKIEDGNYELTQIGQNIGRLSLWQTISGNNNGELYVFDTFKNLIYQLDPSIDQLNKIGAYVEPATDDQNRKISLDKNNNIILNDWFSITYFKVSKDKCLFDEIKHRVNITIV